MPTLVIETEINAAPGICFDLIREASLTPPDEKISTSKRSRKIHSGEAVTFETKRFGIRQKLTVKVTEFEKSVRFVDEMTEGNFKQFKHIHEFIPTECGTLLRDTLIWISPLGFIGKIFDALLIKNQLRKIVARRNKKLKQLAEKQADF